jgi:hypothetical protein
MRIGLIAPEPLLTDRAFVRLHNRVAKDALRDEALHHWKRRIPDHFRATARAKYSYKERTPRYKAIKMRQGYGRTDLVRTGATRDKITREQPTIRMGGRAANPDGTTGQLKLTMRMRFPFPLGQAGSGVTGDQMKKEVGRILPVEGSDVAAGFKKRYLDYLNKALATRPKLRKRYDAALAASP